jgi:hypothetical protein
MNTTERGQVRRKLRVRAVDQAEARLKPNDLINATISWYRLAAVPNRADADHR